MFNLRTIDSLSTTTRGKYLQAALNRPQGPHPPAKSICVGTRKGEDLVRNINNVGCGTLENRKERWKRDFLVSNDPHLAEILIWRNQFFTSNVKGKDMARNIKTECSTEYIGEVEKALIARVNKLPRFRQSFSSVSKYHLWDTPGLYVPYKKRQNPG